MMEQYPESRLGRLTKVVLVFLSCLSLFILNIEVFSALDDLMFDCSDLFLGTHP